MQPGQHTMLPLQSIEGLTVRIDAPDLCYRYAARVVTDVKIAESPEWLKRRLKACGMRAINNIVDITNYVMLELGQPMHSFDINSIEGKQIIVRRAKENEIITTLDGEDRKLDTNTLVIADAKKPVAIAGVMGGLNSEIEDSTKTIVFESAVFNGGSVRLSAKRAGLRTEASSRYEKNLPAENALRAVNRAIELVEQLGAGKPVDGVIDVYPTKQEQRKIKLDASRVNSLLGTEISRDEMVKILESLEIQVNDDELTVPYFRQDIENTADIAEEVLRIYGYDKLGSTLINAESTIGEKNKKQALEDRIKQVLVDNGYQEMYSYNFLSKKDLEKCNIFEDNDLYKNCVRLKNPLGEDFSIMRPAMVPVIMQAMQTNYSRKNKNVSLFEIGRTFQDSSHNIEKGELPEEIFNIAFASYGKGADFYIIKNLVENILEISNIAKYTVEKETGDASMHLGKTAKILVGRDTIAVFGEVHPGVTENYGINEKVYFAVTDLDKLTKYGKSNKKYSEIPKYPAVERDIAVIVDEDIEVSQIENVIAKRAKNTLESLEIFDIYRSEKLGENKKSVAYNLKFRVADRTLTDDEVSGIMEAAFSDLERELNAELRK
ncbi:MAG: phenylalanine--tRNA ligase subunit beta [Firmicutes bacterium]|nr:phenylalanine--tRNA ligase subunit beta [Bacillota bacterium]